MAAPVFDHRGRVRGAIAIAPPIERATADVMLRYAELLRVAAAEISKKLV